MAVGERGLDEKAAAGQQSEGSFPVFRDSGRKEAYGPAREQVGRWFVGMALHQELLNARLHDARAIQINRVFNRCALTQLRAGRLAASIRPLAGAMRMVCDKGRRIGPSEPGRRHANRQPPPARMSVVLLRGERERQGKDAVHPRAPVGSPADVAHGERVGQVEFVHLGVVLAHAGRETARMIDLLAFGEGQAAV